MAKESIRIQDWGDDVLLLWDSRDFGQQLQGCYPSMSAATRALDQLVKAGHAIGFICATCGDEDHRHRLFCPAA